MIFQPQQALPDVFIWALSGSKRLAYYRLPARDIIYSVIEEECGKECGKVQTVFLKVFQSSRWLRDFAFNFQKITIILLQRFQLPGKRSLGPSGWTIQVKLQIYMWLGLLKHKKNFVNGLPAGYEISSEIKNADRPRAAPPKVIHYLSMHVSQSSESKLNKIFSA